MSDSLPTNNLVSVLAHELDPHGTVRFTTQREGWVHIGVACDADASLALDGAGLLTRRQGPAMEAMRFLSPGDHVLVLGSTAESLSIRSVPALVYCKYGVGHWVPEYNHYDWQYLDKHVLPHVNTIVATSSPEHAPYLQEWKRRGGRWFVECGLPGLGKETVTADEVYDVWSASYGVTNPAADGIIVAPLTSAAGVTVSGSSRSSFADAVVDGDEATPWYAGSTTRACPCPCVRLAL